MRQTNFGTPNKTKTILIADDQPGVRTLLGEILSEERYKLIFADNGINALNMVDEFQPDLILLDVLMPGMTGIEVCQQLKNDDRWRHIPIILITALDSIKDLARGLDAGADDFIPKPVRVLEIQARVRSLLRVKEQYDLLEAQREALQTTLKLKEELMQVKDQALSNLEALRYAGLRLMNTLNVDYIIEQTVRAILSIIPDTAQQVMHFSSDDKQHLVPIVFEAQNNTKNIYATVGIESMVATVIATQQSMYEPDAHFQTHLNSSPLSGIRSIIISPLIAEDRVLGTLSVTSRKTDAFAPNHRQSLAILANQSATAILKARMFEELERVKNQETWKLRGLFERYVSPIVVERLMQEGEPLALGGKRESVSVLFADIRGFTTYAEHLAPELLIEMLNQYLALAVEAILEEEGTLDKFMGDAVMAIFNAPLKQPQHTLKAVKAALKIQQTTQRFSATLPIEKALYFGIGIATGEAVVGNIGTIQQMNYTAIGDVVNVANRLQEKAAGGQILLSQAAFQAVKTDVIAHPAGEFALKGRTSLEKTFLVQALREQ